MALTKVGINTLKDTAKTVLSESFAEPSAISGSVVSGVSGSVASTGSFGSIYTDKNVNASAFVGDGSSLTGIDIPTAADISGSTHSGVSGSIVSTGSFGRVEVTDIKTQGVLMTPALSGSVTQEVTGSMVWDSADNHLKVWDGHQAATTPSSSYNSGWKPVGGWVHLGTDKITDTTATYTTSFPIDRTYEMYYINCPFLRPGTDNVALKFQATIDGTLRTDEHYDWIRDNHQAGNNTQDRDVAENDTEVDMANGVQIDAEYMLSFEMFLYRPGGTSKYKGGYWRTFGSTVTPKLMWFYGTWWYGGHTGQLTSLTFYMSSGNMSESTFRCYGLTNASH